jgi:hypothetical protein
LFIVSYFFGRTLGLTNIIDSSLLHCPTSHAYASTQDPSDTPPEERGIENPYIDLNSPCGIIEVDESEISPPR